MSDRLDLVKAARAAHGRVAMALGAPVVESAEAEPGAIYVADGKVYVSIRPYDPATFAGMHARWYVRSEVKKRVPWLSIEVGDEPVENPGRALIERLRRSGR